MSAVIHKGRTLQQCQEHWRQSLKDCRKRGCVTKPVKFSREMWDRMLKQQHEDCEMRQIGIDGKEVKR